MISFKQWLCLIVDGSVLKEAQQYYYDMLDFKGVGECKVSSVSENVNNIEAMMKSS